MIKLMIIYRSTDPPSYVNMLKFEMEQTEQFVIAFMPENVYDCIGSVSIYDPETMLLFPSRSDRLYRRQIEAVVRYIKENPEKNLRSIFVVSGWNCDYAARRLSEAELMYQFVDPAGPRELAGKISRVISRLIARRETEGKSENEIEFFAEKVRLCLIRFDVYPSYCGYRYVVDAVKAVRYSSDNIQFTKELYPSIAKKYGKSSSSVERAIRNAAGVASESAEWRHLFPNGTKPPSNIEFISALTELAEA